MKKNWRILQDDINIDKTTRNILIEKLISIEKSISWMRLTIIGQTLIILYLLLK